MNAFENNVADALLDPLARARAHAARGRRVIPPRAKQVRRARRGNSLVHVHEG